MGEKIFRPRNLPRRTDSTMLALTATALSSSTNFTTTSSYLRDQARYFFLTPMVILRCPSDAPLTTHALHLLLPLTTDL
jgi:hypothetical protein